MSRDDLRLIDEARRHLAILRTHLERGDLDHEVVFDAVCLRLAAAIECVGSVDADRRAEMFGSGWRAVASVRNRIAHGYIRIDRAIIAATVNGDLPSFEAKLDLLEQLITRSS